MPSNTSGVAHRRRNVPTETQSARKECHWDQDRVDAPPASHSPHLISPKFSISSAQCPNKNNSPRRLSPSVVGQFSSEKIKRRCRRLSSAMSLRKSANALSYAAKRDGKVVVTARALESGTSMTCGNCGWRRRASWVVGRGASSARRASVCGRASRRSEASAVYYFIYRSHILLYDSDHALGTRL